MSQTIFSTIDPTISGTTLATTLDAFKNAIVSGCSGTSRPTNLLAGGSWIDTTNDPTSWAFKIYTGTTDISIFTINLTSGVGSVALGTDSFQVKKVSADTVGAILGLIKQRIATNGQVLNGDVVGEIRVTGRTSTSTNPVVAKIIFTATDDMTTSAYGGTLSFYSTPDATATLTEHLRLINGLVETVVPHKLNSLILVGQNVATTATIAQLSASKILVEMTGATATDIQGINSGHDSQFITIHNRSSANVTLKHQNASAAAADRMKLPGSTDYVIRADGSATLYYCTTDTFWKIVSTAETSVGSTTDKLFGVTQTWTAPSSVSAVKVRAYKFQRGILNERSMMLDFFGNAFAWGKNTNGELGLGDVTPRSSPVAVLGGLQFNRLFGQTAAANSAYGINTLGSPYAWGVNTNGQLGVGDVTPRSSPVAVLGSLRFSEIYPRESSVTGLTTNGSAFAWGVNTDGQLGVGDVTPRSSPVAVLGGLKFSDISSASGGGGSSSVIGLTTAGVAYAWGKNTNGQLGIGDVTPRSSPVAVLGSHTFADVQVGGSDGAGRYFTIGLDTAGAMWAWGSNTKSVLGVGDQTARSSPVAVLGGLTFARFFMSPKGESVYAMKTDGTVYAWGLNANGQLGVGDVTDRSSPVAVLGGLTFWRIVTYRGTTLGLTTDGTLYGWGLNTNGQLGVGDVVPRSSPVAVLGSLKFTDVAFADGIADQYSVFGMTTDGLLYSWGVNANGTLGLGDVTPRSSPVAVLGAFAPDQTEPSVAADLTVTGGNGYTVTLGAGLCSFGSRPLGRDIYRVEVEYVQ